MSVLPLKVPKIWRSKLQNNRCFRPHQSLHTLQYRLRNKPKSTSNILDCDQSNVLLAHLLHTDRRQDLGDNVSRDIANVSSNFVAMATGIGRGGIWLTSLNSPTPSPQKNPVRRKHLGDMSHISWVITNCDPNFVAMATRVGRGRIWLTSFNSPTSETPCYMQESRRYLT